MRSESEGPSRSNFAYRVDPDNGYVPFSPLTPDPTKNRVETGCEFPLALPVLVPGSVSSVETACRHQNFPLRAWPF